MSDKCGVLGGLFENDDVLLWFIILFLLLFFNHGHDTCK